MTIGGLLRCLASRWHEALRGSTARAPSSSVLAVACCLVSLASCLPASGNPDSVNVRSHGAAGDGKADDTAAFLAAIAAANRDKRTVYVPRGIYRVAKPLVLEGIALHGPEPGAWPADVDATPVLIPTHRDGPGIEIKAGGSLRGICVRYAWEKEPEAGPPAILVSGIGAWISAVKIMYPWDGIMTDGVSNVGRLNIADVFIVSPRNVGVRVTGTWDVPALRNIEVWNAGPVARGLDKGIGFDLGKNDLIRLTDCFAFAMNVGFLLRDKIPGAKIEGGTWGVMTGCSTDYCSIGIKVEGDNTVSISGGTFWQHDNGVIVDGEKARVRLTGAEIKSNGAPAVTVRSADHVVITGCSLLRPMKEHAGPVAEITGGRAILQGNHIEGHGSGVVIGENARNVVMNGNLMDVKGAEVEDRQRHHGVTVG
ncbi:MAG: hypothetical protein GX446_17405 [Chthonomonadales bacterium]|nr:hypothetical protein [Chthonomonadales bacterium]